MAKQAAKPALVKETVENPQEKPQANNKFTLPAQPAGIDQWADVFHIQANPLGVRLWFGTTRGDASGVTDIRAAIFLPGEVGRLFLAHARSMAEAKKIELKPNQPPPVFN